MSFRQSIKINQLLLNKLKCVPSVNDQIKTILNCIEGDFILYHGLVRELVMMFAMPFLIICSRFTLITLKSIEVVKLMHA